MTTYDAPVVSIINDHFASILTGEECMATPAISEGVMYWRTRRNLVAVEAL